MKAVWIDQEERQLDKLLRFAIPITSAESLLGYIAGKKAQKDADVIKMEAHITRLSANELLTAASRGQLFL